MARRMGKLPHGMSTTEKCVRSSAASEWPTRAVVEVHSNVGNFLDHFLEASEILEHALKNYEIIKRAGAAFRAAVEEVVIPPVTDRGNIQIDFIPVFENPLTRGIEVQEDDVTVDEVESRCMMMQIWDQTNDDLTVAKTTISSPFIVVSRRNVPPIIKE